MPATAATIPRSAVAHCSSIAASASPRPASNRTLKIANISGKYPLRILLAEDNTINVKMMVMLMRKLGYELLIASNGVEALELLEREATRRPEHEVEVILMDASMDVMDGMECTRMIRAQQLPTRRRPFIIAQTANVTEEYQTRCLQSGMDLFLAKVNLIVQHSRRTVPWRHVCVKC